MPRKIVHILAGAAVALLASGAGSLLAACWSGSPTRWFLTGCILLLSGIVALGAAVTVAY